MSKIKKYTKGFTILPNDLLNDKSISFKAKGIYAFLNSKPDGWEFSVDRISAQTLEGRDAVRAGILELEKAGMLTRTQIKNSDLQFGGYQYNLFDYKPNDGKPVDGNAVDGKPVDGKPDDIVIKKEKERISKKDLVCAKQKISFEKVSNHASWDMMRHSRFPDLTDEDINLELILIEDRYKLKTSIDFATVVSWLGNANIQKQKVLNQQRFNEKTQETKDKYESRNKRRDVELEITQFVEYRQYLDKEQQYCEDWLNVIPTINGEPIERDKLNHEVFYSHVKSNQTV